MAEYTLSMKELLKEYMDYDPVTNPQRFGQYIVNKYAILNWNSYTYAESDPAVFYEKNNGVAYKMILNRIFQQDLEKLKSNS